MRIREPKTTALIFASGKMVVTGAKSEELSRLAARKYARIVQKLGFPAKFTEFKIQNIVGSCDVKFPIRLEGLAFAHGHYSSHEPELFPGLIYRMEYMLNEVHATKTWRGADPVTGGRRRVRGRRAPPMVLLESQARDDSPRSVSRFGFPNGLRRRRRAWV